MCVHCPVLQQHLFSALGREMTPTFLGGDLNFDAVSHNWYEKMDAAIAERQAHPKGHQVSRMAAQGGVHAHLPSLCVVVILAASFCLGQSSPLDSVS